MYNGCNQILLIVKCVCVRVCVTKLKLENSVNQVDGITGSWHYHNKSIHSIRSSLILTESCLFSINILYYIVLNTSSSQKH